MPNRIVRESILTSEAVSSLAWPEEVFYRRLMSIVDDYGRCEALPQLLRSRCYPLQTDQVRVADITRWMAACQKAGLVALYEVAGKPYLQIEKFGQQQRSASKCPEPPALGGGCNQLLSVAHLGVVGGGGVFGDVGVEPSASSPRATLPACPFEEITGLYHEILPSLPRVKLMRDKRRRAVGEFWKWLLTSKKSNGDRRAATKDEGLAWLRGYFGRASENDFLMGRTGRSAGHENWECDLDFLLSDKGLKLVIEKTREAA